jgi:hypothetical protein
MIVEWIPTYRRVWNFDKIPPLYPNKIFWLHPIKRDKKLDGFQFQFFGYRVMTYRVYVGLVRLEVGKIKIGVDTKL